MVRNDESVEAVDPTNADTLVSRLGAGESLGKSDKETAEDILLTHQFMAQEHINKDRCLLRRDTKLSQNGRYDLGEEDKARVAEETCEDDEMQVQIDRSRKIDRSKHETHNHYTNPPPTPVPTPTPTPTPTTPIPPWLWPLLLLLMVAIALAIGAILTNLGDTKIEPTPDQTGWQLDIGVRDPIEAALDAEQPEAEVETE